MGEEKKGFILFLNFLPMIDALTDEEAGRLIKAIMHHENGEFPQTDLSEQLQAVEEAMLERQGAKRA